MEQLKYNWGVTGHDKLLCGLEEDIATNNVAHAYLFAGPDGVEKYKAAKTFARILQCKAGYCGECDVCREIEKGYHSDTVECADNAETLKIEQIRLMIDKVNMTKTSNYKVLLLQNVERASAAACNAMLKTLEDPPPKVVFILTTNNLKEILPTIVSRVRLLKFRRLSDSDMKAVLQNKYPLVEESVVASVCMYAQGRVGKALQLMENEELLNTYKQLHQNIELLLSSNDRARQFMFVGDIAAAAKEQKSSEPITDFLVSLELVLRKQMLMSVTSDNGNGILPAEKCVTLLQKIQEAKKLLKNNINSRLILENLMLNV